MLYKKAANNKYTDFSVMAYVVWIGVAGLSCIIENLFVKSLLFLMVIGWFLYAKQARDSWNCSVVYRVWGLGIIATFGIINILKASSTKFSSVIDVIGMGAMVVGIVIIHIIWWFQIRRKFGVGEES